ncbi:DUF1844 domain-containing protein [Terracidiphilus gabretensis]|uniref:DUF1844 domain-containing protein n=1 Tax=Terracidiphilus gabretensis TaxID=1577687 RepID=UPI00071B92C0|nr:DUF1844 domain-containing protein [Terracidiphilus gabretensis]
MSDTPKFEVIDRRKRKLEEEAAEAPAATPAATTEPQPEPKPEPSAGPRLVVNEPVQAPPDAEPQADGDPLTEAPTAEESRAQKSAYDASAEHLEDLIRAQNPGAGPLPPVTFDSLVQQLYLSTMMQMGAGTQEGQRPRVDILGARQTIDLLGILAEKTKGNVTPQEDRMLQTVLFETRMAFLELTNMITLQPPPPPPVGKK